MNRTLLPILLGGVLLLALYYLLPRSAPTHNPTPIPSAKKPETRRETEAFALKLKGRAREVKSYARRKGFSTEHCFLIDMSLPSGKNRFFIYDLKRDSVVAAGLVAHGSCNTVFLRNARFSNTPNCGCSSVGRYKVGYKYKGRFGRAYKLHGLDSTNSNAFRRAVVLHAYDCIPDREVYPLPACNSLGCPMVSYAFLDKAAKVIDRAKRPILLWVY
ncbi:MAG TPA: murein L,D-transpeptidase catalytic domain family protein [Chitinophagaceae bacterium]